MSPDNVHKQISDYLTQYARETPEREAVVFGDQRLNYTQLRNQVLRCAKALLALNVKKGDRIAVLCTSRTEYWVVFLATTSIGAIWLGLNPKYRLQELRYLLQDARPKILFAMAAFEGRCYEETVNTLHMDCAFIERLVALTDPMPNALSFSEFLALSESVSGQALNSSQMQVDRLDPALLVYTSGTTGRPKGAVLSHYGLCFGSAVQNQHYQVEQPRNICSYPINHAACVADTCCVNLVAGGTLVFQERFDPAVVLQTIRREDINTIFAIPTTLLMLLEHPNFEHTDFSSLELIIWGGAALPAPVIRRLQTLAPRLMNVYGMTETAANTTYTGENADLIELSDTVGRPSPEMPCRIINEKGERCEVGEHGELQFQGEYLLLEYLNRPEATRDVYTEDRWLHTGDLGYWREDGTISLVGRLSDMFKSGGYNIYPREIEILLESHPDIDMAAVVSTPDALYQEVGAAYVVVSHKTGAGKDARSSETLNSETLRAFCLESLANFKVPKYFTFVSELPMLPVGKIDKVSLKRRARRLSSEVPT